MCYSKSRERLFYIETMSHQRNLIAQNPKGEFINLKVGHDGHIETNNMKTSFGESTTAQLAPVLQEIFPYTINTRVWTKTEAKSTISFDENMAEFKTTAVINSQAIMVSKKRIKYRTGMGVMCRFTALWDTDESENYQSFIGIGENDINNGFYFFKDNVGMYILHSTDGVDNFILQEDWDDPCDGTGDMPALDWSKGNVFQIQFQYLGFGNIKFSIENPDTGEFQLIHMIKYANRNLGTSLRNTTLPFSAGILNVIGGTGIQILKTASCALFVEGTNTINTSITNTAEGDKKTGINEIPVLSIRNKALFNNTLTNYSNVYPTLISITNEDTKANVVKMILNGTLTNPAFADVDAKTSIVDIDTTASAVANGTTIFKIYVNPASTQQINLRTYDIQLNPSDVLTFTQKAVSAGQGNTISVIANFVEDQ